MSSKQTDDLIAVDDAAETYRLSRATIFRLVADDKLKSYKRRIGDRKTYIRKTAIQQLLTPQERL